MEFNYILSSIKLLISRNIIIYIRVLTSHFRKWSLKNHDFFFFLVDVSDNIWVLKNFVKFVIKSIIIFLKLYLTKLLIIYRKSLDIFVL